jgi:hypothetical protein
VMRGTFFLLREIISLERENLFREKITDLAFCFDLNNSTFSSHFEEDEHGGARNAVENR